MKTRLITGLLASLISFLNLHANGQIYLGSREGDPESLVENVSVIHGDYTEVEVDLTVDAPDPLVLSRFYSSRDFADKTSFGGWRLNPHCVLTMQKDPKGESCSTAEGNFEKFYAYVGSSDGSILTFVSWKNNDHPEAKLRFRIDPQDGSLGIANTARRSISAWTNQKNHELVYDVATNSFELLLSSEGRRFYVKHSSSDHYFLTHEVLPSGNKIFYEYDELGRFLSIKETNAKQEKVLAWIKFTYHRFIQVEASDGQTLSYSTYGRLPGVYLLAEVRKSNKQMVTYHYDQVDGKALLLRKNLPEGHFVQIDYFRDQANQYKVKTLVLSCPEGTDGSAAIHFAYENNATLVVGPARRKTVYRYDNEFQLTSIDQYLDEELYRIKRKVWGRKGDAGNLMGTSVEDAQGSSFYYQQFAYDTKGNLVEEKEYGDLLGTGAIPLVFDGDGLVINQVSRQKTRSYFSTRNTSGFCETDQKGTQTKSWYKKGSNLLLKKFILTKEEDAEDQGTNAGIKERHFYTYNDDAALVRVIVDDGKGEESYDLNGVTERRITYISPKLEMPNVGAPRVIEEKCSSYNSKSEFLLTSRVFQFDGQGKVVSEEVYDANGAHRYTLNKRYQDGLLVYETDPLGHEIHYAYDASGNLIAKTDTSSGIGTEHVYDLRNRLIFTREKDRVGNHFETHIGYDAAGNKIKEIDHFGNETSFAYDTLGRLTSVTYPDQTANGTQSFKTTFTYTYDLFDNPISVKDPMGRVLNRSYTVKGELSDIEYLDGTREQYRYDQEGKLVRTLKRDGTSELYAYDYKGRRCRVEYYRKGSKCLECPFKTTSCEYSAFRKTSETDARSKKTSFSYDAAGRLTCAKKEKQKCEFSYDALGRVRSTKRWKSSEDFTLEIKEYDLLGRVIEETCEDSTGKTLSRMRYVYNDAGKIAQLIGYPQNHESILMRYEYDWYGRLSQTANAAGAVTAVSYDDAYTNEWGKRFCKRTLIDSYGNRTEEIFDYADRVIWSSARDGAGRLLGMLERSFDCLGKKLFEKRVIVSDMGPFRNNQIDYSYNEQDLLENETFLKGTPQERVFRFEYDANGKLSKRYNPGDVNPIAFHYDSRCELEKISYKEGKKESEIKLQYDENHNLVSMKQGSHLVTRTFDGNDLLSQETVQDKYGSYQIRLSYDGEGKVERVELPDGSSVEYTYEGPFVKSVVRFNQEKKKLYTHLVISRDQMGHVLEEILPSCLGRRAQNFDEAGRKMEIITSYFQDKVLKFGPHDQIQRRESSLEGQKETLEYDFNPLFQLVSEKGSANHVYCYDSLGSCLKKDERLFKVNEFNELIEGEGKSYSYDACGNLVMKSVNDNQWTFQTNPLGQLIFTQDPDQNRVTFAYDFMGRRLSKKIEGKDKKGASFRFFYLGDTEIGAVDEKGTVVELKIPLDPQHPEKDAISIEMKKEIYVPLYDLKGNIACLLDFTRRKVVESYSYTALGEEQILSERKKPLSDSAARNPWRYLGKRIDKEIGLIYMGGKYYDPELGRAFGPHERAGLTP
jgi:YD repeat-containing protein